jgi:hypothetical protein
VTTISVLTATPCESSSHHICAHLFLTPERSHEDDEGWVRDGVIGRGRVALVGVALDKGSIGLALAGRALHSGVSEAAVWFPIKEKILEIERILFGRHCIWLVRCVSTGRTFYQNP